MICIHPLAGVPEVAPGDDVASLLAQSLRAGGHALVPSAIVVVTQKIVSKAENRFVRLTDVVAGAEARRLSEVTQKDPRIVEVVLSESTAIVRAAPRVLITRHRLGFVLANAGVDSSNIGPGREDCVLLLPRDPDESARRIAAGLGALCGLTPGIVISDSFGRPWRLGVVNVAIGAAGVPVLRDFRGEPDRDGRILEVTEVAHADLIASAAGLAMGESGESVPAALVCGLDLGESVAGASALVRPVKDDLFA